MKHTSYQSGFTLVETLIAVLILAMAISALLTLSASGFFTIRYAKNDIVGTYLLQESLEYIRNHRDTYAQNNINTQSGATDYWQEWLSIFEAQGCFTRDGCMVNPYAIDESLRVLPCDGSIRFPDPWRGEGCSNMYFFDGRGFYGYLGSVFGDSLFNNQVRDDAHPTSFIRTIHMEIEEQGSAAESMLREDQTRYTDIAAGPIVKVTATMEWMNGTNRKQTEQSILLTKWNFQ